MDMIPLFSRSDKGFYVNFFIFGDYVNGVMSTTATGCFESKKGVTFPLNKMWYDIKIGLSRYRKREGISNRNALSFYFIWQYFILSYPP